MTFLRTTLRTLVGGCAAALASFAVPTGAGAQQPDPAPALSLSAGAIQYDLSGTGTAPMVALRADFPLGRFVLVEPGVAIARPDQQFGRRTTFVVPEVQLQAQLPIGSVRPYLSVGGGLAMDFRPDGAGGVRSDVTASAAGGLRWWLTDRIGTRAELRVRGIGQGFTGASAEWTGGLAWRF